MDDLFPESVPHEQRPHAPGIFVDALRVCIPTRQWKWDQSCHLFCHPGDEERLHLFASSIGMKREWFQDKPGSMPHYDLTAARRRMAVSRGAQEVNRSWTTDAINRWRTHRAALLGQIIKEVGVTTA